MNRSNLVLRLATSAAIFAALLLGGLLARSVSRATVLPAGSPAVAPITLVAVPLVHAFSAIR